MNGTGTLSLPRSAADNAVIEHFALREQELLEEQGRLANVVADLAWDNYWLREILDGLYRERAVEKRRAQRVAA